MLENMKIAYKIGGGFLIILLLMGALGFLSWNSLNRVAMAEDIMPGAEEAAEHEVQLMDAQQSQTVVFILTALAVALLIGIFLAVIITLGIIRPLRQGVDLSKHIARGELNATLNIEQHDDIDQATQSSTASAEESASAAEEALPPARPRVAPRPQARST